MPTTGEIVRANGSQTPTLKSITPGTPLALGAGVRLLPFDPQFGVPLARLGEQRGAPRSGRLFEQLLSRLTAIAPQRKSESRAEPATIEPSATVQQLSPALAALTPEQPAATEATEIDTSNELQAQPADQAATVAEPPALPPVVASLPQPAPQPAPRSVPRSTPPSVPLITRTDSQQLQIAPPRQAEPRIEQQPNSAPAPEQRVVEPAGVERTIERKHSEPAAQPHPAPQAEPHQPDSVATKRRVLEAVWIEGMGERKQIAMPSGIKSLEPQLKEGEPLVRVLPTTNEPFEDAAPNQFASHAHRPAPPSAPPPSAPKQVAQVVPFELAVGREPMRVSMEITRPPAPPAAQSVTLVEQIAARIAAAPPHGVISVALDPPELGRVLIKFQRRGRELSVRVEAEHPEALRQLRHELPQLEAALSRLREPVVVELLGQGDSRDAGFQPQREPSAAQQGQDRSPQGRPDRETTPHHGRRRPRPRSSGNQLDVWS